MTRGRIAAANVAANRHAPGSRKVKSILIAGKGLLFAGALRTGISGGCPRGGRSFLRQARQSPTMGCSTRSEEGSSSAPAGSPCQAYRVHLRSGRVDPHAQDRDSASRPRRNRRRNRSVAFAGGAAKWGHLLRLRRRAGLHCPAVGAAVVVWLATRPSRRKTRGTAAGRQPWKGSAEARVKRGAAGGNAPPAKRARTGRSKSCARASFKKFRCRSRMAVPGAESRARSTSPDLERARGRAPRPRSAPQNAVHGRRGSGRRIEAEHHVTANRDRRRPAHGAGAQAMEGAPGRHGDGSSQTVHTRGLGLPGGLAGAKSSARRRRDDRGARGSIHQGANGPTSRAPTWVIRRSGQGGVKRRVPQSPSRRVASQAAKGRSASSGEKLRTAETRVLVIDGSEKQVVGRNASSPRSAPCRKAARRREWLARRRPQAR